MTSINARNLKKALTGAYKETWRLPNIETAYVVYHSKDNKFSEEWSCGYIRRKDDFIVAIISRPRLYEWKQISMENLKELVQYFKEEYLDILAEKVSATVEKINNHSTQYEVIYFRGESDLYN